MEREKLPPGADRKKTWAAPRLETLDIGATAAGAPLWQFMPEGDFYKRVQLLES